MANKKSLMEAFEVEPKVFSSNEDVNDYDDILDYDDSESSYDLTNMYKNDSDDVFGDSSDDSFGDSSKVSTFSLFSFSS